MLRFLLLRPVAVTISLVALLSLSIMAYFQLPVSLLPDADVPEITITAKYPNGSHEELEQTILKPIRENMLAINGLRHIESIAQNESGSVSLHFEYGTPMSLAYIEVNEKIDRLTPVFPGSLERPLVSKSSISDIPIIRLQVIPKTAEDLLAASQLSENVLKKRLEQLDGVGLVDMNGLRHQIIQITPNEDLMQNHNLTYHDIAKTIEAANLNLGGISLKDGHYKYFVKLASRINTPEELELLQVRLPENNGSVMLKQIASVSHGVESPTGYHLLNHKAGIVISIHKQANAKLPELIPQIVKAHHQFKEDYPQFDFSLTQDQSSLLTLSIQNLSQAVVWGGAFAFGVLFLFMRGWREPLIMGIVIPLSLLLAFSLFYLFKISLNIISLSGLILGLGMLVDNSIVVIDNIILKRKAGEDLTESCIHGTHEVIVPLISSALTNLAVFLPLIFMSGITGTLFFDQAISVASILFVSILCTFIVVPLLYILFFRSTGDMLVNDSRLFLRIKNWYEQSFLVLWNYKKTTLLFFALFVPVSFFLVWEMPKQGFPEIDRTESILTIDWNEPIDAEECRKRVSMLLSKHENQIILAETEVGYQQFVLNTQNNTPRNAQVYIQYQDKSHKATGDLLIKNYLSEVYPTAQFSLVPAPNAFEQLFSSDQPNLEARLRNPISKAPIDRLMADSLFNSFPFNYSLREGFKTETMIYIQIDRIKLMTYEIEPEQISQQMRIAFGNYLITDFKNFGESVPVIFTQARDDFESTLKKINVLSKNGLSYPIRDFIKFSYRENYRSITADELGIYQAISIEAPNNLKEIQDTISEHVNASSLLVDFTGQLFENKRNFDQLVIIMLVSLLLMYFILTAEFESLKQPFLVMSSFPVGLSGSIILLWLTGGTLNIMSGIGLVVVLGILDNDAILKVDRINRLRKILPLKEAIFQAGKDRFRPIVMNTFTNVLALSPIIFSSGLGADLQRPIAIATVGGLIVGTLTALYFVPIMYWYTNRENSKS